MAKIKIQKAYQPTEKPVTNFEGTVSKTKQDYKEDVNVNFIMEKYQRTKLISHIATYEKQYGDFTSLDYQNSMNTMAKVVLILL